MNRRLFFITLLMLFCSTVFGQEPYYEVTNVNAGDYTDNMPLIAKVSFDGAVQLSDQLEVGVFCGDQLRASLFTNYKLGNDYYVFNAVWGKTGEVFTFKVYDHRTKTEWYYNQEITVKGSKKTSLLFDILGYGTFDSPAVIDFKTPPYYIPNTDALNSMLMAALVQIDGVEQSNGNLELGAFINDTVRGSARVNYNVNGKMYAYMQVYGKSGQEVTFKLYDHDAKEEVRFVTVNTVNFNEDGYLNFSNPLTVNFRTRYAHFDGGAYAAYAANKPREHFSINLYDVYASQSLVVKVYHDETLLLTTTYRDYDLDDTQHTSPRYPVSTAPGKGLTVNNVVSGKVAGSWLNEYEFENEYSGNKHFAVDNVPNKFEVYVDGTLTDTYNGTQNPNAGFSSAENLKTYLGFDGVYKAASVTRGTDVTYYMTLAEAFAAATQNGDIVTLYDNVTLASSLNVNRNVVLELNGYNIESNTIKAIVISNAQLTVNDSENKGVISAPQATLYVAENAKLIVNGGTIEGASAIQGNGSLNGTEVTINGGKIDGNGEIAIYHPQNGVLNINGGTIVGSAGVEMRAGTLNMTAGTVEATGTFATRKHDSGQTVDGVAIALSQHTTNHNVDINITGGTIKSSANGKAFYQDRLTETYTPSINITADIAATVEGAVEAAELGYNIVENNGVYTLVYVGFEAQIGEVKYETLVEAVEAAQPDATVTLLKSATGAGIVINKNITIDFGGFTYSFNEGVGSTGTESNGFQILQGNTVVLKNGTLNVNADDADEFYILVQNYANLTVEDMNLDGTNLDKWSTSTDPNDGDSYVLSNNSGTVNITGATNITANNDGDKAFAFDVCKYGSYAAPTVNVNTTGTIAGKIEVSEGIEDNLNISGGLFTAQIAEAWCAEGFFPTEVEIDGNTYYTVHEGLLGSGTETDPFIIRSLGELKFFRDHVNAGKTTYNAEGVHVALAANIDMASEDWSVNIGDDCNYIFDGIFDGKGYTISNLNGTETAQKADGYVCTGLFGAIHGSAVVKNLTIENVNITAGFTGNNAAAVVGFVYGDSGKTTTIENVTVKGDVIINASGVYGVGAIVGYSYEGGAVNIKNCKVVANEGSVITATSGTGAIIGYCAGRTTIDGCTVDNIDITGKGLVGGIAGITSISNTKNLTNNTVKNVNLAATKAEWVNSTAIAVGTMSGDGLTVANTIFDNVNASRMVGSVYAEQPTYVVPAVEARIENKYYGTFDAALAAAAQEGNTITVLAPVVITEDKTYDLTGLTVAGENVYPIFRIQNNAEVTVKGEGTITNDDYVFVVGASDSSSAGNLTIESGVYTGTTTVASVTKGLLTINGGEFKVNASEYGATYMINCIDANYNDDSANVEIKGGTFHGFDPENNLAEGAGTNFCAEGYLSDDNGNGTYTVREGVYVAQVGDKKFESFDEAFAYAKSTTDNDAITILKTIVLSANQTIDFESIAVTSTVNPAFRITDGATVTVENGNMNTEDGGYNFILGASDGSSAGNLTIKSGKYHASITVASVTKGNLVIEGGEFSATPYKGSYAYLINCIDANYTNGSAKVEIKGGTFHNWNPQDNAAEGTGTDFCHADYAATETAANVWTVLPAVAKIGEARFATLQAAINAVQNAETINIIAANIDENVNIVQKEGLSFTIDGQIDNTKVQYTGTISIDGNGGYQRTETLTIKNINFYNEVKRTAQEAFDFIVAKSGQSHNVTVESCDFTDNYTNTKNYVKGAEVKEANNWKFVNCTANERMMNLLHYYGGSQNLVVNGGTVKAYYGIHIDSSVDGLFEGVAFESAERGFTLDGSATGEIINTLNKVSFNDIDAPISLHLSNADQSTRVFNIIDTITSVSSGDFASSEKVKYVLAKEKAVLQAQEGLTNIEVSEELAAQHYEVVYEEGFYAVAKEQKVKAIPGGSTYPTLAEALSNATTAYELVFLADINENVTIDRNLKISGEGKNYTGTMSISSGKIVTVENINFVKGCIDKQKGTGGTLKVIKCNFDGVDKSINYAVTMRGGNEVTIDECSVVNYSYGMLYVPSAVTNVNVKETQVNDVNYGVHVAYGKNINITNVTMTDVAYGIMTQNYGAKTITIDNSSIYGTNPIHVWERNTTIKDTFKFKRENTFAPAVEYTQSTQAVFELATETATLQAPSGLNVTTKVEGYIVDYADGKYYLRQPNYVAAIGETKYESLQEAIDAAQNGDVIGVIEDHTYDCSEVKTVSEGDVLMLVENKNVTIDLNGKVVTVDVQNSDYSSGLGLIAAICANNAELTLKDSSEESTGKINVLSGTNNVYCLVYSKNDNTKLTIESGAYYLDKTSNVNGSLVYADRDNTTFVNGGDFYLGNANQDSNKQPWIFNTWQNGVRFIIVKGGTYNANPLDNIHGEGRVHSDKAVVLNPDGKYEVVDAVANIGAKGYASIADAVNAAQANETVTVIKAHKITSTAVVERDITIDFGGLEVTSSASPAIRIQGGANVTVKNGNMNTDNYNFILGASDGSSTGNLTIESGSYKGASSVASVTKGLLTINGGEFEANASQWGSTYLINCIDANYKDGSAKVEIKGGKFHQFNPENNAAEGAGTNFCATGYIAERIECEHGDCYEVIEGVYVAQVGEVKYTSLQAAIDAAQNGDEIVVLKDITLEYEDAQDATVKTFFNVNTGKTITIDLNGYNVKAVLEGDETVTAFFHISNSTNLTLKDLSDDNTGTVEIESEAYVSTLLCNDGGYLTVENGNYILEKGKADGSGSGGLVYSGQDEVVTINGGYFYLGNVGTSANGSPWIFNASGQNTKNIIVNGGTFNDDILHQYYPFEVKAPKEKALQYDADKELWTMVDAVAYVDEQHESGNYYTNEVGYATLEEAVAARKYNENADHVMTVTLLKEIDLGNTTLLVDSDEDYKNSNINFDFAEKDVEGSLTPAIRIQGGANVTIKNGKMNTTGYNFILGASDGSSAGNLTIESGEYHAQTSVVSVTKGHLNITGGEFSVEPYQGNYAYLINCIDANYNNGSATVAISGGTFHNWNPQDNAAETGGHANFCASGYGAVETSTGVWEVVPMQGITLHPGWNWFSSYINIEGEEGLETLQNALAGNATIIKSQSSSFTSYSENGSWYGELESLSIEEMYMIQVNGAYTLSLTGDILDPSQVNILLHNGWNWIAYPISEEYAIEDVMVEGIAKNDQVKSHHEGFAEYFDGSWYGELNTLKPGKGYMYGNMASDHQFTYTIPAPGTKSELRANVTAENNRWVPASSQFVNNMTMVAMVDGVNADSYEVAAFVNGEVRGSARPIYIEPLDAYMLFLTIYGDEVEEMTFRYYDLTTGEEYALDDRINYSNDARVGSIAEPYIFRGTVGIGENAMTEINIYPNPTTTGSEVNLGSVCDTVEVFNALGVKIAEYQNVDSIDALETAGIYVIRITNNGNVQNCRLIVK